MKRIEVTSKFDGVMSLTTQAGVKYRFDFIGAKHLIPEDDLINIGNQTSGRAMLTERATIEDKDFVENTLRLNVEPEYYFTIDDYTKLLEYGTTAQVKDALEFGGEMSQEVIRYVAVKTDLADMNKIKAISDSLGVDFINIMAHYKELDEIARESGNQSSQSGRRGTIFNPNMKEEKPASRTREQFIPASHQEPTKKIDIEDTPQEVIEPVEKEEENTVLKKYTPIR